MATERRPNFLIFMTDHQQGATVDPAHPCLTPAAERLAKEGLRFARAYTPTAHCCPSRASFFTGLYPSRHGVWNNVLNGQALSPGLDASIPTFGEVLRQAGYTTVYSGKWHISSVYGPSDRGWDVLMAGSLPNDRHGLTWDSWEAMAKKQAEQDPCRWFERKRAVGEILRPGWGDYRLFGESETAGGWDDTCVDRFTEAVGRLASDSRPWCAFIGPNGPHDPYVVPRRYLDLYDLGSVCLPESYGDTLDDKPRIYQRLARQVWGQLSAEEAREAVRHYWAYCTRMDSLLARAVEAVDAAGCKDDTVVIFLSDHGDYAGAHGLFAKGIAAFDEAYRVPCVVRWPRGITQPGRTVDEFVTLADIAPTLYELAGIPAQPGLTGRSIVPFFKGVSPQGWTDEVHAQMNGVELYYSQRYVATKDWKYVMNGFDYDELYDLRNDPHETVNLAGDPSRTGLLREMAARMWRFARAQGDTMHNSYITVGLAPVGPMSAFTRTGSAQDA